MEGPVECLTIYLDIFNVNLQPFLSLNAFPTSLQFFWKWSYANFKGLQSYYYDYADSANIHGYQTHESN